MLTFKTNTAMTGVSVLLTSALILAAPVVGQTQAAETAALYEAARAEGRMALYFGSPDAQTRSLVEDFQAAYPGIDIEMTRLVGPALFDRFMREASARQHIADVIFIADYPSMTELIRRDLISEWEIPTIDRFSAENRLDAFAYAPYLTDMALAYNTNLMSEEEVQMFRDQGWEAVLDPRFEGRFAASTLACGICYAGVQMFLTNERYGEEFLRAVAAQNPTVFASTVVGLDRVVAGELDFIFWSFESAALPAYTNGAPIRWVHPQPQMLLPNTWLAISENARRPNAARLFVNWMTSEEGALAIQRRMGGLTTIEGVPDGRPVAQEPWYDPIVAPISVDFDRWERLYFEDMKVWQDLLTEAASR